MIYFNQKLNIMLRFAIYLALISMNWRVVDSISEVSSRKIPVSIANIFRHSQDLIKPNRILMHSLDGSLAPTENPTDSPSVLPTEQSTLQPSIEPTIAPTVSDTSSPSEAPSIRPSWIPTIAPTVSPSSEPSTAPTIAPTVSPTIAPTVMPTVAPTVNPTISPSVHPSINPTEAPSEVPTITPSFSMVPTESPSEIPTVLPTYSFAPSISPTVLPSVVPSIEPTETPTVVPTTVLPTVEPTIDPSCEPTIGPTFAPTVIPSIAPTPLPTTIAPSKAPTTAPSPSPSEEPTIQPSEEPTIVPSFRPTCIPSIAPSEMPTVIHPSESPTTEPTMAPTVIPSIHPSEFPTEIPTDAPTVLPTIVPSELPTQIPSITPTDIPTVAPSACPSVVPSAAPTVFPSVSPSIPPSVAPSHAPSIPPTTIVPTVAPSLRPSIAPSQSTSVAPTVAPSTSPTACPSIPPSTLPTIAPSTPPSACPSISPSANPSEGPTLMPTEVPTVAPSTPPSLPPSYIPSSRPSSEPSSLPTADPTVFPTTVPTIYPTSRPSSRPSSQPSSEPSTRPTGQPTRIPTRCPTGQPSRQPSGQPSGQPTRRPTGQPTNQPINSPTAQPTRQPFSHPTGLPSCMPSAGPTSSPSTSPSAYPSSFIRTLFTFSDTTTILGSNSNTLTGTAQNAFIASIAESLSHVRAKDVTIVQITFPNRRISLRGKQVEAIDIAIQWKAIVAIEELGTSSYEECYNLLNDQLTTATSDGSLQARLIKRDPNTYTGTTVSNAVVELVPTAAPTKPPTTNTLLDTKYIIIIGVIGGFFVCMVPIFCYVQHSMQVERDLVLQREREHEDANDRLYKRFPHVNPNRAMDQEVTLSRMYANKQTGKKYQTRDAESTNRPRDGSVGAKSGRHVTINTVNTNVREFEHISDLSEEEVAQNYHSSDTDYEVSRHTERSHTPPIPSVLLSQEELQFKVNHLIIVNKTMRNTLNMEVREFSSAISYFMKTEDELTIAQLSRLQEYMNNLDEENYKLGERLEKLTNRSPNYEFVVEPVDRPPTPTRGVTTTSSGASGVEVNRANVRSPSPSGNLLRKASPVPAEFDADSEGSVDVFTSPNGNNNTPSVPQRNPNLMSSIQYQQKVYQSNRSVSSSRQYQQQVKTPTPERYVSPNTRNYHGEFPDEQRQAFYGGQISPSPIPIVVPEIPKIKTFTDVRAKYYADMMRRGATLGNSPNSFTDASGQVVNQRRSLHHNVNYDARDPEEVTLAYNTQKNSAPSTPIVFAARQVQDIERRLPAPPSRSNSGSKRKIKYNNEEESFLK